VVVLGKRAKNTIISKSVAEAELESSIADAEAIFATMLVELKMDFSKIFTVTELADGANSKFMGMSFQLSQLQSATSSSGSGLMADASGMEVLQLWDHILQREAPEERSQKRRSSVSLSTCRAGFCTRSCARTWWCRRISTRPSTRSFGNWSEDLVVLA